MAKKQKPVAQEFNTIEMKDGSVATSTVQESVDATVAEKVSDAVDGVIDVRDDIKEKLLNYEHAIATAAELSAENSALKDKLSEYVAELTQLRAELEELKQSRPAEPAADTSKLIAEIKSLQTANDNYLMQISELTFNLAKLTAETQRTNLKSTQNNAPTQKYKPNPYRQSFGLNGYNGWN